MGRPRRGAHIHGIFLATTLFAALPIAGPAAAATPAAVGFLADRFLVTNARAKGVVQTASGLQYLVLKPGGNDKAGPGTPLAPHPGDDDVALLTYVGKLTDGTVFDQSAGPTPLPVAGLVPGFTEALKLMPRGATYRVWIKPSLGYGGQGSGAIPANAVLVFDIALIDFMSVANYQAMMQGAQAPVPANGTPATVPGGSGP